MKFTAFSPHEALRPYIKDYWHLSSTALADGSQRIVSNGSAQLQFYTTQPIRFGDDDRLFTSCLNIHSLQYTDLLNKQGPLEIIGVEFMSFGTRMFFDMPMSEGVGLHLTPTDLNDSEFAALEEQVMGSKDDRRICQHLDDFFLHRLRKVFAGGTNLLRMQHVVHLAENTRIDGDLSKLSPVALAEAACLSPKQFTRIFHEYVGLQPKSYLRLLRYHAAVLALQQKAMGMDDAISSTLTDIAWQCGYYDLSHMTVDFQQISGNTPAQILAEIEARGTDKALTQAFQPTYGQMLKKFIRVDKLI